MQNETLTGEPSREPPPEPLPEPLIVREPRARRVCLHCRRGQTETAGRPCEDCRLAIAEITARNDALAFQLAEAKAQRRANTFKLLAIAGTAVVVLGLGILKYGVRSHGAAEAAGSVIAGRRDHATLPAPTDDFSHHLRALSERMCWCRDLACAREVQVSHASYVRTRAASDERAARSAARSTERLHACLSAFERGDVPPAP